MEDELKEKRLEIIKDLKITDVYQFNRNMIENGLSNEFIKENWLSTNSDMNRPEIILAIKEAIVEKDKLLAERLNYSLVRSGAEKDYIRDNWIPVDGDLNSEKTKIDIERASMIASDISENKAIYDRVDLNNESRVFDKNINKIEQLYYDKEKLKKTELEEIVKLNNQLISDGATPSEIREKWIPSGGDKNSVSHLAEVSQAIIFVEERRAEGYYSKDSKSQDRLIKTMKI